MLAIKDDVIARPYCPPSLDPTKIQSVNKRQLLPVASQATAALPAPKKAKQPGAGRPAKSKKGGALTRTQ